MVSKEKKGNKMTKINKIINVNDTLDGDLASSTFKMIVESESHSIKYDNSPCDEDYIGHSLLSESGLYEFHYEYHDDIVCSLKKIL